MTKAQKASKKAQRRKAIQRATNVARCERERRGVDQGLRDLHNTLKDMRRSGLK